MRRTLLPLLAAAFVLSGCSAVDGVTVKTIVPSAASAASVAWGMVIVVDTGCCCSPSETNSC